MLAVKFKISNEHPSLFHIGVPPRVPAVSVPGGATKIIILTITTPK